MRHFIGCSCEGDHHCYVITDIDPEWLVVGLHDCHRAEGFIDRVKTAWKILTQGEADSTDILLEPQAAVDMGLLLINTAVAMQPDLGQCNQCGCND